MKFKLKPIQHNQIACKDCSIRRLALFNGVPDEELSWTQNYRSCQYALDARSKVYREGVPSEFMFTVYHGWMAVYKTLENGKRQILKVALPGDIIGYQANLAGPMNYSAVSLTDSVLCAFPRTEIPTLFRNKPGIAKRLAELNSRDMHLCQNRMTTLGQHTALEKIAHCCAELFYRKKAIHQELENNQIKFPLSQEDIGDLTGLTKIHVNRVLRQLREMGLMEISSKELTIYNTKELCKLGYFDPNSVHTHILY